ncbi:MAG: hypothetical protein ACPG7F_00175 [Aggregatilineales bacterium]
MNQRIHFITGMVTGAILLWLFINTKLADCADIQPGEETSTIIRLPDAA